MPDGTKVNFPDTMSREQIKGMIATKFPEVAQEEVVPTGESILPQETNQPQVKQQGGFSQGQQERGAYLADIVGAQQRGEQTLPETALQVGGNVVGTAADVIGAGIGKAAELGYNALPQGAQDTLKGAGQYVAQSPVGQFAGKMSQEYDANLKAFEKSNPRFARNLKAIREAGAFVPLGAKPVRDIAGGVVSKASDATVNVARGLTPSAPAPIYKAAPVKELSSNLYKQVEEAGGSLRPEARDNLINKVEQLADVGGERLTSGKNIFEDMLDTLSKKKGQPLTLQGIESLDKELTGLIQKERTIAGITPEGVKLQDLQDDFRNAIRNPTEDLVVGGREGFDALQKATNQWAAGKKLEEIENIFEYAKKTDNPATSIKSQFRTLSRNKKRMAGYTPQERELIKQAAESSLFADFLRTTAGSRLISSVMGTVGGAMGGGFMGAAVGGGAGAALSGSARKGAEALQKGRVKKLQREVSKRVEIPQEIYNLPPKEAKEALKRLKQGD
jgi:hypothetical protein